tara:strand:- start:1159 stop:1674 length:516 start_codon:yes stop_codon:yes gene_type:complete
MRKRGQLGKAITTFPVMILVFLVMVIFVALAALAFELNGSEIKEDEVDSIKQEIFDLDGLKVFDVVVDFVYNWNGIGGGKVLEFLIRDRGEVDCIYFEGISPSYLEDQSVILENVEDGRQNVQGNRVRTRPFSKDKWPADKEKEVRFSMLNKKGKNVEVNYKYYKGECENE